MKEAINKWGRIEGRSIKRGKTEGGINQEKEREREGSGRDSWNRTDEMLCLICDSSTILFFTAAKNRDKVTDTETQITLDAPHYYEDDTGSGKPNFAELGSRISRQRGKRQKTIKGIVGERELQLSVSGLIYNSYFIVMSWQDLFNFSLLF